MQLVYIEKTREGGYKRALRELYYWRTQKDADWFTAQLFNLLKKADGMNRTRLARGFPEEVQAFQEWEMARDELKFLVGIRERLGI